MQRNAVVVGATGMVGSLVWRLLADRRDLWQSLILVTRRPLENLPEGVENRVVDFQQLEEALGELKADDLFVCLGTTIAKAGSQDAFRQVDCEYVLAAARGLMKNGLSHLLVITAMGSDEKSLFFYNRVKGEVERRLRDLNLPYLTILRPSLLLGERREQRFLEKLSGRVGQAMGPLFVGPLRRWAPVSAHKVAETMVAQASRVATEGRSQGCLVLNSEAIQQATA
ncbi:NAD(P)H-binding protein [Marinobacteraceae bacterium S3BR75-40.1]